MGIQWVKHLDKTVTIGDLLSNRFEGHTEDLEESLGLYLFRLCAPELEAATDGIQGEHIEFSCGAVHMAITVGEKGCWCPLTQSGREELLKVVRPRIIERHKRRKP
jgi:hypothetical protein